MNGQAAYLIYESGKAGGNSPAAQPFDAVPLWPGYSMKPGKPPKTAFDIDHARQAITRIAPWCPEVWAVPELWNAGGEEIGGYCETKTSRIILAYADRRFNGTMSTLYHELFHAVQNRMDHDDRAEFYAEIGMKSYAYGDTEYLDKPLEQSARLFQYFAMYLETGGSFFLPKNSENTDPAFLMSVYTGKFADRVALHEQTAQQAQERAQRLRDRLNSYAAPALFLLPRRSMRGLSGNHGTK
jgi:hypothetical protein